MTLGIGAFDLALDQFEMLLRGVSQDRWDSPTPCPTWTTREVVGHVVGELRWAVALVEGVDPENARERSQDSAEPSAVASSDPLVAWLSARDALREACTPEALDRRVRWPFGEQTVAKGLGIFSVEVLVHAWDVARATGQDIRLDPDLVGEHLSRLRPFSEYLRGPGMYGPEVEASPGADEQAQLLAFLGRRCR